MGAAGSVTKGASVEQDYVAHRRSVLAMLRADFGGVPDHEELYQEAWTEALELMARGETIGNLGGLLRTIAWRRARDRLRKHKPETLDPSSPTMLRQESADAAPDETVATRLDAALIRQVVDSLDERQAAVIKLRFERQLGSSEIERELGVTRKRLDKIVTEAYARVEEALHERDGDVSPWRRRQRSLLMACEAGVASMRQREQAQAMLREDQSSNGRPN